MPSPVRAAVAHRGHRIYNLWMFPSHRLDRTLILSSDVHAMHFALLEIDQRVTRYTPEAPSASTLVSGELVSTRFDATVEYDDGEEVWQEIKAEFALDAVDDTPQIKAQKQIAADTNRRHQLITRADVEPKANRVWNAFRILQTLKMAKRFSIAPARTAVVAALLRGELQVQQARTLDTGDPALNLAALFSLYMDKTVTANLDKPLCERTVFTPREQRQ